MNKTELVAAIAAKTKCTKRAAEMTVEALLETFTAELAKGEKVQIIGFGTFEVRARKARKGRNPQSGEALDIPAANLPVFTAGKALKEAVNK